MAEPTQGGGVRGDLPPLAPEDHVCAECGVSYAALTVREAVGTLEEIPARVAAAARAVPAQLRQRRPGADVWSVVEYACHVRDVYASYTIRLHRARTEDRPAIEPMLNDLRARRFRYNDRDLDAVLDDLAANAAGFRDEIARMPATGWDRTVTRLPGEVRTARWLVRQATHEGTHHAGDIERVGRAVTALG